MDTSTKKVVDLLGKGLSTSEVSEIFGVSASAVSHIRDQYAEQIAAVAADKKAVLEGHDALIDKVENKVLMQLDAVAERETDGTKLAAMFRVLNNAHRRRRGESPAGGAKRVVNLQLNHNVMQQLNFSTNTSNEIVEVEGRNLSTASHEAVSGMLEEVLETEALEAMEVKPSAGMAVEDLFDD